MFTVNWVIFVVKNFQKIIFHMIDFHTVQVCTKNFTHKYLATCAHRKIHVCIILY